MMMMIIWMISTDSLPRVLCAELKVCSWHARQTRASICTECLSGIPPACSAMFHVLEEPWAFSMTVLCTDQDRCLACLVAVVLLD